MSYLDIGNESLPSIINDPFNKKSIVAIHVFYQDYWDSGKWEASGTVKFKNGDTSGEQKFKGKTFDEVVSAIKIFIQSELNQ
jgi:hypothetical protein